MNEFVSARAARNTAKATFDESLAHVRGDLETRSIGGRITDKIVGGAADVSLEAVEIVEQHKLVVAGTLATIVLWFVRNSIIAAIRHISARLTRRRGAWS